MKIKRFAVWLLPLTCLFSSAVLAQPKPAIISAGSSVTEILLALGAGNELVAVDVTSQLPPSLSLPKVGYHRQLSAEGLIALQPTLLIGSDGMGPATTLEKVKSAGIPVAVVNSDARPESLLTRIDQIAALTGTGEAATRLKETVSRQIEVLNNHQPGENKKKKVLFLLLHGNRGANAAGRETTPDAIIQLAGGINPAAEQFSSYKTLSQESLIEMQPDVVLVSGRSFDPLGGPDKILSMLPGLAVTPAGKNNAIINMDAHALIGGLGLSSVEQAMDLQKQLYQ